jgi:hypothetical protein
MLASGARGLRAGRSGAPAGLGAVATTTLESRANSSVPITDAHLSVAFEDMDRLSDTTACAFISSDLDTNATRPRRYRAETPLRSA